MNREVGICPECEAKVGAIRGVIDWHRAPGSLPCAGTGKPCYVPPAFQLCLLDYEQVAQARAADPRSAKTAAAKDRSGRAYQRLQIVAFLIEHGPSTADDLAPVIGRHRSVASTRLAVVGKAGHAEKCGVAPRADEYGKVRDVELWRVTPAGATWLEAKRTAA